MAKVARIYVGANSYGVNIEVAQSVSGKWFYREFGWNGYGKVWSKWAELDTVPTHPTKIKYGVECASAPEYYEIPAEEQHTYLDWGFNILRLVKYECKYRLPN